MMVFTVTVENRGRYVTTDSSIIAEDLAMMERGEVEPCRVTIECGEMSHEELDALPDFRGF